MKVGRRQQLGLTLGEPFACRRALALRAMPIAAAIEADGRMAALPVLAARDVPPSAAVRQRSIALITFRWPRFTCPRLASRQRGRGRGRCPRPRSITPTRPPAISAACHPLRAPPASTGLELGDRARDRRDPTCRDARVACCRIELVVSENRLDQTECSAPASSRCVANEWRSVCRLTRFLMPAAPIDSRNRRLS